MVIQLAVFLKDGLPLQTNGGNTDEHGLILDSLPQRLQGNISGYYCASDAAENCGTQCTDFKKIFIANIHNGWEARRSSIQRTFEKFGCEVSAEIGIAYGGLARHNLQNTPSIKEYHGIDPFIGGYDKSDEMSSFIARANASDTWAQAMLSYLGEFGCRFKLHHGLSTEVAKHFPDNSIDCLFIDGDHTYQGVKDDIAYYYHKIKFGGVFMFDDYGQPFPGVIKAVDAFTQHYNYTLVPINNMENYYVIKQ